MNIQTERLLEDLEAILDDEERDNSTKPDTKTSDTSPKDKHDTNDIHSAPVQDDCTLNSPIISTMKIPLPSLVSPQRMTDTKSPATTPTNIDPNSPSEQPQINQNPNNV